MTRTNHEITDARALVGTAARAVGMDADVLLAEMDAAVARASEKLETRRAIAEAHANGDGLESRWYASLAAGTPDLSVYADPLYVAEAFACWVRYSRRYLNALDGAGTLSKVEGVVVDLGCGLGLTTATLAERCPKATHVVGTNLPDTPQTAIAKSIGKMAGFTVAESMPHEHADLVFASDFFEHMPAPVAYLGEVIQVMTPRLLVTANTFNAPGIGHFADYGGKTGRTVSREFGAALRGHGYQRVPYPFWNGRPQVWSRPC